MSYYLKYEGNYWDRKVLNKEKDFDLRLLKHSNLKEVEAKKIFKKYVELVCLEMSYYCNRACNYCPVHTMERSDKNLEIPKDKFDYIISSLKEINYDGRISLNLFNEPMASKNIYSNIKNLSQELPNAILSLNSNGDYIKSTESLKKLDTSGLKEILITMHTPKNKKWNREYSEKQMIRFAKKVNFKIDKSHLKDLKFAFFVGKLHVEVFCTDWASQGNSRGGELKNLTPKKNRITPCEKPIREFVISYDGAVQLCCHIYHNKTYNKTIETIDPKTSKSIFQIYVSKVLTESRKSLFDYSEKRGVCAKCNHYEDDIKQDSNFFYDAEDESKRKKILEKI